MSDCDIVASVEEPDDVEVVVEEASGITALVVPADDVTVEVEAAVDAVVEVEAASSITALVVVAQDVVVEVAPADDITAEIEMTALTGWQSDKLNSIAWGARNDPIVLNKLWDITFVESTRTSGDSVPFFGTQTFQEVGRGLLVEHSFQDSGWILVQVVADFYTTIPTGSTMGVEFAIETASLPDPFDPVDSTRGTPQAFTRHHTFKPDTLVVAATETPLFFTVAIQACGNVSSVWKQRYVGDFVWDNSAAVPERSNTQPFGPRALTIPIDPTVNKYIRAVFRMSTNTALTKFGVNWTESTKTLTKAGHFAGWSPRVGDKINVTAGSAPVVPGLYSIASKLDDSNITLSDSITGGSGDVLDNSITFPAQVQFLKVVASRASQFHPVDRSLN